MTESIIKLENKVQLFELAERLEKITCVPQELCHSLDETKKQLKDLIISLNEEQVYVCVQSVKSVKSNDKGSQFVAKQLKFISLHFFVYQFFNSSFSIGIDQKDVDFHNYLHLSELNEPYVLISMKRIDYKKILDNLSFKTDDVLLNEITKAEYENAKIVVKGLLRGC